MPQSFDILDLLNAFSAGNLSTTKKVLAKYNEQNQGKKIKSSYYEKIVECACRGRCTEYIELLSTILPLDQCPIVIQAAQYGIINWINELKKYGDDFSVNNFSFFDEAIVNGDGEFLKEALNTVDEISESVWKRIVNKSVLVGDEKVMSTLKDCLMSNEKYYNIRFMAEDIITSKTTLSSFLYFADLIIPESLENLTSFVDYISLSFLQELIKYKRYHNIQLKATVLRACQKNRLDIAYIIISEFPFIQIELLENMPNEILRQITIENFIKAQSKIGNILKKNETSIHSLKEILAQTFDIGMLTIQENKSLLDLAGMDNKYLWILNALPDHSISQFCFDKCFSFKYQSLSSFSTVFAIFK